MASNGPERIIATGGLRFWKDGRDVPDVMLGLCDYPETDTHPAFNLSLQTNFAHGGGKVVEDSIYGFRAAAPAILNNASFLKQKAIKWDPEKMLIRA